MATLIIDPGVPTTDPFYAIYPKTVSFILGRYKPTTQDPIWAVLQTLYEDMPSRFVLISGIHQNDENDTLHFSIRVMLGYCDYTLHFYGYWKSVFQCTHVECMGPNFPPVRIVSFR